MGDKRILFLSAYFFDYNREICRALQSQGFQVDYFDERPANTFFVKAMIRLRPELLSRYIDNYHQSIIERTKGNRYDYIFIIKAESISQGSLESLRKAHPKAKMVLYLWDSFANFKNGQSKLPLFDRALSFDRNDCQKYGMVFRPLFYTRDYASVAQAETSRDIDVLFIGTMHSDRYRFVKSVERIAVERGLKTFYYLFFMSKLLYFKMKFSGNTLKGTRMSDFHFVPIGKEEMFGLLKRAKAVVDIQHPRQTGLTMRTIEVLGGQRKLITTNPEVRLYDFYRPENILVVDRDSPVIPPDFFKYPYRELPQDMYAHYSIDNWLKDILGESHPQFLSPEGSQINKC